MNQILRTHAEQIMRESLAAVQPDEALRHALTSLPPCAGKTVLVCVGKAAWRMARVALEVLGEPNCGIVITKYGHMNSPLPGVACYEAGHPVPDENSFLSATVALGMVAGLEEQDRVVFLLSGGSSALFELPLIPAEELQDITRQLLASGADIVEINTVRKRLSAVKGGRFAAACAPARVYSVLLSDIVGSPVDMIGSGPTCPDPSTCEQALEIVRRRGLTLSPAALACLARETPKELDNAEANVIGSVRSLCDAAVEAARALGYQPVVLTNRLTCEAREAGRFLAGILRTHRKDLRNLAFLAAGETVVHLTGSGKGGRNQELALAGAEELAGLSGAALFSVGSDGTDGPTDAAGGYVDADTLSELRSAGFDVQTALADNDSYTALKAVGGLLFTGPTGTNVNDVAVGLLRGKDNRTLPQDD